MIVFDVSELVVFRIIVVILDIEELMLLQVELLLELTVLLL